MNKLEAVVKSATHVAEREGDPWQFGLRKATRATGNYIRLCRNKQERAWFRQGEIKLIPPGEASA